MFILNKDPGWWLSSTLPPINMEVEKITLNEVDKTNTQRFLVNNFIHSGGVGTVCDLGQKNNYTPEN